MGNFIRYNARDFVGFEFSQAVPERKEICAQLIGAGHKIHPWIAQLVDKNVDTVRNVLNQRFQDIHHPALIRFRDYILDFEIKGVVFGRKGSFIELEKKMLPPDGYPFPDEKEVSQIWLLAPPILEEEVRNRFKEWNLPEDELLIEFYSHFGNLAEDPTISGSFSDASDLVISDSWDGISKDNLPPDSEAWQTAITLYRALNGNEVLLRQDTGEIAWFICPQENRLEPIGKNFEAFVDYVIDYKVKNAGWPLDAYGP